MLNSQVPAPAGRQIFHTPWRACRTGYDGKDDAVLEVDRSVHLPCDHIRRNLVPDGCTANESLTRMEGRLWTLEPLTFTRRAPCYATGITAGTYGSIRMIRLRRLRLGFSRRCLENNRGPPSRKLLGVISHSSSPAI